ncbi:MAG: glycosyltransferase family 4 protein [Gammaproteobacteria bacterium]|nr:glycosyltransferase family 4 protein [Gammaproteobacteria bacterium]
MRPPAIVFAMTGATGLHGGIAVVNLNLLRALAEVAQEHGLPLTVLAYLEGPEHRPPFLPAEVTYRAFQSNRYRLAAELWRHLPQRPLFIFDHVNVARALLPVAAIRAARTVIFAHGWENWRTVNWSDGWSLRLAERVLANSEFTRRKIAQRFPTARVDACPLGLHPGFRLNPSPPPPQDEGLRLASCDGTERAIGSQMLLLAARMDPTERQKGHRELLAVVPQVAARHPGVQIVFTGTGGDYDAIAGIVRELGVGDRVFMPGQVTVPLLEALFRQCAAFVMPSTQEGFGLVYLEAMNAARPCIGCLDQGTEDVVQNGVTGLLVRDPADGPELAAVVSRLLDDPAAARAMGQRGFERLHELFTAEKFRARFKAAIAERLS